MEQTLIYRSGWRGRPAETARVKIAPKIRVGTTDGRDKHGFPAVYSKLRIHPKDEASDLRNPLLISVNPCPSVVLFSSLKRRSREVTPIVPGGHDPPASSIEQAVEVDRALRRTMGHNADGNSAALGCVATLGGLHDIDQALMGLHSCPSKPFRVDALLHTNPGEPPPCNPASDSLSRLGIPSRSFVWFSICRIGFLIVLMFHVEQWWPASCSISSGVCASCRTMVFQIHF